MKQVSNNRFEFFSVSSHFSSLGCYKAELACMDMQTATDHACFCSGFSSNPTLEFCLGRRKFEHCYDFFLPVLLL